MTGLFDAAARLGIYDPIESKHPEIRALYEFWLNGRDSKGNFNYKRFDVLDLPRKLVSKIYLIRVHANEMTFEVRIVGNDVIQSAGINATGRYIGDMPGAELSQKRMEFCVKNNIPYAADAKLTWGKHDFKSFDVGTVPLHHDDGRVAYLLSVVCIYSQLEQEESPSNFNATCSNLPEEDIEIFDDAFAYWLTIKGDQKLPIKSDIDVTKIPKVLPHLILYDVLTEPLDFKRRLIGEDAKSGIRRDVIDKSFREQPGKQPGSLVWSFFKTVCQTAAPRYGRLPYEGHVEKISSALNLLLPFSDNGVDVKYIMNVIYWKPN
ncbi:MAG: hypothetical protein NXI16_17085 [Alphaproteobacteria bacterium]|nr:hypothetical protein [Alphaproteobacteria bacterium]